MQAVAQMPGVDLKGQTPAIDVDQDVAGPALFFEPLESANTLGDVAHLLVNLAGGEGGHGCLQCGTRVLRINEEDAKKPG